VARYRKFLKELPAMCADFRRKPGTLTFADLSEMIGIWLESDVKAAIGPGGNRRRTG
jgi:hypothetical protein